MAMSQIRQETKGTFVKILFYDAEIGRKVCTYS